MGFFCMMFYLAHKNLYHGLFCRQSTVLLFFKSRVVVKTCLLKRVFSATSCVQKQNTENFDCFCFSSLLNCLEHVNLGG